VGALIGGEVGTIVAEGEHVGHHLLACRAPIALEELGSLPS
jgi:hypothetical protein